MKKILILPLLLLCLFGCESKEESASIKDPMDYTLVTVSAINGAIISEIILIDETGHQFGIGTLPGAYYVPKNGSLSISWDGTYVKWKVEEVEVLHASELKVVLNDDRLEIVNL